jgi:hypothetical protein
VTFSNTFDMHENDDQAIGTQCHYLLASKIGGRPVTTGYNQIFNATSWVVLGSNDPLLVLPTRLSVTDGLSGLSEAQPQDLHTTRSEFMPRHILHQHFNSPIDTSTCLDRAIYGDWSMAPYWRPTPMTLLCCEVDQPEPPTYLVTRMRLSLSS